MAMPTVGASGPEFALFNQHEHIIQLSRLVNDNEHVVVYFFPQPGAPGCTVEAKGFRDLMPQLTARGVAVVGITSGSMPDLKVFARENELPFSVLHDPTKRISEEWGALRGENTARMTFIVNQKGTVTHAFPRVDVWKHAGEVLALFGAAPVAAAAPAAAPAATAAPAAAPAAAEAAPSAATAAVSTAPADLIVATARAAMQLLLSHQKSGGAVPADVVELAAALVRRPG